MGVKAVRGRGNTRHRRRREGWWVGIGGGRRTGEIHPPEWKNIEWFNGVWPHPLHIYRDRYATYAIIRSYLRHDIAFIPYFIAASLFAAEAFMMSPSSIYAFTWLAISLLFRDDAVSAAQHSSLPFREVCQE